MSDGLLPLVIVFPLAGGGLALLGKAVKNAAGERVSSVAAVASLAGTWIVLLLIGPTIIGGQTIRYALGGWPEPYGIAMVMDGFAWLSSLLVTVISSIVAVSALSKNRYGASFFFFLLLLIAGMLSVVLTGDLFTMFVSFEIVAIAAYVLIAYEKTPTGLVASLKYLILSSVGILFFLFGVFLIYRDLGTLSIAGIGEAIRSAPTRGDLPAIHLAIAAICVGIGVRTAFIPFHTWLPEAHAYAPHPISALLSGVLIKVSFFAMMRILTQFRAAYLNEFLLWIGGATAVIAVILALAQSDAKRLLAYHSVSQMGYVLAAFAASTELSLVGSLSHAVNHALFKSLLFLTVGTAVQLTGKRNLHAMGGLGRRAPLLAVAYLVGALSIAGLPPFNGYASKAFVFEAVSGSPIWWLLWITSAATIASFIKLSRVFLPARSTTAGDTTEAVQGRRPGALITISTCLLAILCIATGVFSRPLAYGIQALSSAVSTVAVDPRPYLPALYSGPKLLSTVGALLLGVGIFLAISSSRGKAFALLVRGYAPDVRAVMLLFFVGLVGFAAVAYL